MRIELKRDLGWAVLVGATFAASTLTGAARPFVSLALGAFIAIAIYGARVLLRPRLPHLFDDSPPRRILASPSTATWALLGATLLAFLPTLIWLYDEYTANVWRNNHGIFVPLIVISLARSRLRAETDFAPDSSVWGAPVLLVGVGLALIDAGVRSGYLGAAGLVIALQGLSLLLLGARRTRVIAFPLVLTLFLLPVPPYIPDPVGLTSGTSFMIEKYLQFAEIPAYRHHSAYFSLPAGMFAVSTNCGGLSFFYAACFVAVIIANATRSTLRRVAILLAIWPVTVAINGIRGTILIGLANTYGTSEVLDHPIHGLLGIVTFWAIFLCLLPLADLRHLIGTRRP